MCEIANFPTEAQELGIDRFLFFLQLLFNFNFKPRFFRPLKSLSYLRRGYRQRWRCRANAFTFSTGFFRLLNGRPVFHPGKIRPDITKDQKWKAGLARSELCSGRRGGHSINSLPLLSGLPANPLPPPFRRARADESRAKLFRSPPVPPLPSSLLSNILCTRPEFNISFSSCLFCLVI